jgi:AcrR family transcriptional regulator
MDEAAPGGREIEDQAGAILGASERESVLRAMAALCAERGYEMVRIEDVAARSGTSSARIGKMFGDKERLGTETVKAILSEVMATVASSYSPDSGEAESGIRAIRAILELMAAHPSFAHLSYIGSRQMMPRRPHEVYLSGVEILCAMVDRLRPPGSVAPPSAARAAFGSAEALVRREITAGRTEMLPRLLPDLVYGATVSILGQKEALRLGRMAEAMLAETQWDLGEGEGGAQRK